MFVTSRLGDVERLADHVPHVTERSVADRHLDAVTEVAHGGAALQTVGGLQADGAAAAFADLLRDLGGDGDLLALELDVHLEREVDLRQRVGRELDVDDGTEDRDDPPVLELGLRFGGCGHGSCCSRCFKRSCRSTRRLARRRGRSRPGSALRRRRRSP